jgi:hypothetical protein
MELSYVIEIGLEEVKAYLSHKPNIVGIHKQEGQLT